MQVIVTIVNVQVNCIVLNQTYRRHLQLARAIKQLYIVIIITRTRRKRLHLEIWINGCKRGKTPIIISVLPHTIQMHNNFINNNNSIRKCSIRLIMKITSAQVPIISIQICKLLLLLLTTHSIHLKILGQVFSIFLFSSHTYFL